MTSLVVVLALGYLSGSLPWGLWLGRWLRGVDVRTVGSRNLGATNVYRSLGPGIGIAVLVLDIAKGALPVWLVPTLGLAAGFPGGPEWCRLSVGLGVPSPPAQRLRIGWALNPPAPDHETPPSADRKSPWGEGPA